MSSTTVIGSVPEKASDLDNTMADQKKSILAALNTAMATESASDESAAALTRAADILDFIRPMWEVLGYDHDARNVAMCIRMVATALQDEVDWEIKEKRIRKSSDRHIQRAALIARLQAIVDRTAWVRE